MLPKSLFAQLTLANQYHLVEDRESCVMKTLDQIAEGDYELAKGSERTILTRLHRKLIAQLKSMEIENFKEQRKFKITGPVMASMALLIKVYKKKNSRKSICIPN